MFHKNMALLCRVVNINKRQVWATVFMHRQARSFHAVSYVQLQALRKSTLLSTAPEKAEKHGDGRLALACKHSHSAFFCSASESSTPTNDEPKKKTEVTYSELLELLDSGNIQLFDVRQPKELELTGQIPQSVNIPLTELKCSLESSKDDFVEQYGVRKPEKEDSTIVFYGLCDIKGVTAVELAQKLGYKQARHYRGGFGEWKQKVSS